MKGGNATSPKQLGPKENCDYGRIYDVNHPRARQGRGGGPARLGRNLKKGMEWGSYRGGIVSRIADPKNRFVLV